MFLNLLEAFCDECVLIRSNVFSAFMSFVSFINITYYINLFLDLKPNFPFLG